MLKKCRCCKRIQESNIYNHNDICSLCNCFVCYECEEVEYRGSIILHYHNYEMKCIWCITNQFRMKMAIHKELLSDNGSKQYNGRKSFCF